VDAHLDGCSSRNSGSSDPSELASRLKPYLENIPTDKPLVMIVCQVGKTGFAMNSATQIRRAVVACDDEVYTSKKANRLLMPLEPRGAEGTQNWLGIESNVVRNPAMGIWSFFLPNPSCSYLKTTQVVWMVYRIACLPDEVLES
jgi:hypothetical protein